MAPLKAIESHLRDLEHAQGTTFEARLKELQTKATMLAYGMDFAFLRDPARKLLSIGFVVTEDTPDSNCYDLLASESRLAVFLLSQKETFPRETGSVWGGPLPRLAAEPHWYRGLAQCLNILCLLWLCVRL